MDEIIGILAGQIWAYLNENGSSTVIKIKSHLEISNGLLHLALGWLAREGKITITKVEHTFEISLKK